MHHAEIDTCHGINFNTTGITKSAKFAIRVYLYRQRSFREAIRLIGQTTATRSIFIGMAHYIHYHTIWLCLAVRKIGHPKSKFDIQEFLRR